MEDIKDDLIEIEIHGEMIQLTTEEALAIRKKLAEVASSHTNIPDHSDLHKIVLGGSNEDHN